MNQGTRSFGAYELVRALGVGGMAETYVATRRGPGEFEQQVCLKRILPAFERDETFIKMFLEEARLAARLRHTNIVQVIDFGVQDGSHYLVLELVDGLDLKELLRELKRRHETLASGLVALIAIELASALDFAHTGGRVGSSVPIVHRDLSPSNVLVSYAGEIKLTDFGIAKALKSTTLNLTQTIKGKVPYMAPEYALEGRYDRRSDLFALGVLLYECLAGERPYRGATDVEVVKNTSEGKRIALATHCPAAPPSLVKAIEKLIDPDPDRRFSTANDFLDALTEVAPSPTARRTLGSLAHSLRPHPNAKQSDTGVANNPTVRLGSTTQPDPPPGRPASNESGPDAVTRTQHPDESVNEDKHRSDAPTRIDEDQSAVLALAAAETKALKFSPAMSSDLLAATRIHARDEATTKRRRGWQVWLLLAPALLVGVLLVRWYAAGSERTVRGDPRPSPSPSPSPSLNLNPSPSPSANPTLAAPPPAPPGEQRVAVEHSAAPARLNVVIIPFGDVWVDGARVGESPARITLPPGTHRVSSGPSTRPQTVRLHAGESRSIEIRTVSHASP